MQLGDLVKPLDKMTDEELIEHLRQVRTRRSIIRPARQAIIDRAEKKEVRGKVKKVTNIFEGLSEEDRNALIEQLKQGELDV